MSHVQRMEEEYEQLSDRMDKLKAFLGNETFMTLDEFDQRLLRIQYDAMRTYATTLHARIHRVGHN